MLAVITDITVVKAYFAKLGLEPEIADLYLTLYAYGPQTISQLSRNSSVERTRIYRLMQTLQESGLVELEIRYKRSILKAAPVSNLQILLTKKEQELKTLEVELERVEKILDHQALHSPITRVQFYQGLEGTKQMFWNETRAKGETLCILYEPMQSITNSAFFERWVRKCNERNLHYRGIISDHFIKSLQAWYTAHSNERLENWNLRYVPDNVYPITHSMIMYDDMVAYYNWKSGQIFGIEIHNPEIAIAQRYFFEMLWQAALPFDDMIAPKHPSK